MFLVHMPYTLKCYHEYIIYNTGEDIMILAVTKYLICSEQLSFILTDEKLLSTWQET